MRGIILSVLDNGNQKFDERRPLAKVAHFAAEQMLHLKADFAGLPIMVENARFGPKAQGEKMRAIVARNVHRSQILLSKLPGSRGLGVSVAGGAFAKRSDWRACSVRARF